MKKTIVYIILIISFFNCKTERKNPDLNNDKINSKNLNSNEANKIKIDTPKMIDPVKWTTSVNKISKTDYELVIVADIEKNYHLYSQKIFDDGPLPTVFLFQDSDNYDLIGVTSEEKGHTTYDSNFKSEIKYFETNATFKQKIKVKEENNFKIIAEIEFMSCNNSKCFTGYSDIEFQI